MISPIITAFAGVAIRRYRFRPAASILGFAFSLLFVGMEMSVRSIDLFLVSRNWAVGYGAAASEAARQAIAERIQIWDESVAAGFIASATESAARLAEGYLGQAWLSGFNNAAYFPVVLLNFGTLAMWLGRQAEAGVSLGNLMVVTWVHCSPPSVSSNVSDQHELETLPTQLEISSSRANGHCKSESQSAGKAPEQSDGSERDSSAIGRRSSQVYLCDAR